MHHRSEALEQFDLLDDFLAHFADPFAVFVLESLGSKRREKAR